MAIGEYTSVQTQNEAVHAEAAVERREIEANPDEERAELAAIWESHGMSKTTASAAAEELMADTDKAVWVHIREELGVDMHEQPSPWTAAFMSFLFFATGALVPLLPLLAGVSALWVSLVVGGIGLFVTGAVAFGMAAAAITYGVGHLVHAGVH
jgi:VIT1/CCC1 family predicted Fe2+/Mn2+ transporter